VSGEELMSAAEGGMKKLLQNPDDGRALTKAQFRFVPLFSAFSSCEEVQQKRCEDPSSV